MCSSQLEKWTSVSPWLAASSGAAMTLVNNLDAIASAAAAPASAAAALVSLFSVANSLGCGPCRTLLATSSTHIANLRVLNQTAS